ncbi:MAG: putative LPS assembly protein LptD, partial [Catalinimonas sp.]
VKREVTIYPQAEIQYGDINLTGDTITISYLTNLLYARGSVDSTGKAVGTPVFSQGGETYVAKQIRYNFIARKGIISGVITQQGEGYIHGETIKKNQDDELFIRRARYTTCNLPDPHFEIVAPRIKVLPGDKLISGPFNLHIADVPTPLGFAFGIFPTPRERSSGLIVPVYGEADTRGFFLRDGGFYWAVNDHLGLKLLGNIYTRGSWGLAVQGTYRKRYVYNGSFSLRYNNTKTGIEGREAEREEFWVNWSHAPQTRRNGRFAVSINAGSATFNELNSFNTNDYLSNTFRSSISYSNQFRVGPAQFNWGTNLRQDQNTTTEVVNFTLPDANLSMSRINPFVRAGQSPQTWWQKINIGYDFQATNRLSNQGTTPRFSLPNVLTPEDQDEELRALSDSVVPFFRNLDLVWDRAQIGARHSVPVSTSFQVLKYINVAPSLSYQEFWYLRRDRFTYDADSNAVRAEAVEGFSRAYQYNAGVGFNTRLYGIVNFGPRGKVQAIRHVLNPTLSFSYSPDFSDPRFGIYDEVQVDAAGTTVRVNPYQNSVYSGPGVGRSGSVGLGLNNQLEMKVRQRSDTAETTEKVSLLDNLGINTSYNLAADSFNLSNLTINA